MGYLRLVEFERSDERKTLSVPPCQEDTHLSPALAYVPVSPLATQ